MSWASLAAKAPVPAAPEAPPVGLDVPDEPIVDEESDDDAGTGADMLVHDEPMMDEQDKRQLLVVDTGGIVKGAHLQRLAEKFVTIEDVLKEVRDKKTRAWLDALPYQLELREPSDESFEAVSAFAGKTGDLRSLSRVDLRVLALTWMMEKECCGGVDHLKTEPNQQGGKVRVRSGRAQVAPPGWHEQARKKKTKAAEPPEMDGWGGGSWIVPEEEEAAAEEAAAEEAVVEEEEPAAAEAEEQDATMEQQDGAGFEQIGEPQLANGMEWEEEEDTGLDWLCPDNIDAAVAGTDWGASPLNADSTSVACVTTDFAMQNVLLQMGLKVLSVDGMVIRRARTYILKCEACFKTTTDLMKQFCGACGNHTLYKVSVQSTQSGVSHYELRSRTKKNNLRGTRFSIPLPKGGRNNSDVILREDQLRAPKAAKAIDWCDPDAGWEMQGKRKGRGQAKEYGVGRRNPNAAKGKVRGKKR